MIFGARKLEKEAEKHSDKQKENKTETRFLLRFASFPFVTFQLKRITPSHEQIFIHEKCLYVVRSNGSCHKATQQSQQKHTNPCVSDKIRCLKQ